MFDKQLQVDDLVDDIAFTLGVNRADLNIVRLVRQGSVYLLTGTGGRLKGTFDWVIGDIPKRREYHRRFVW